MCLRSCSVSVAAECSRNPPLSFRVGWMCEKTQGLPPDKRLLSGHGSPLCSLQRHRGREAEVQRLPCVTRVLLFLTCRVFNDAEGDKSLQKELRGEAHACRPAAVWRGLTWTRRSFRTSGTVSILAIFNKNRMLLLPYTNSSYTV